MSGEQHVSWGPVLGAPVYWDKKALIAHVETGMLIELATIPLYFCALYSIKQDKDNQWASSARMHIISVAEQEMLHLALAGNMLRSLNGTRALYDRDFMPKYPSQILFDKVDMKLQPANKENLECFLRIEAPYMPPPDGFIPGSSIKVIPEYKSIGQFYKTLETGIKMVSKMDQNLFSENREMQLTGDEFFGSKMTVITDETTALQALNTIVDQGEGNIGVPDSHYSIFVKLYQQRQKWQTVDFIDEPKTDKYAGNKVAYRLSLAVNASYCYLLQTIDLCWKERDAAKRSLLFRNLHRLMIEILSPCAQALVTQELNSGKYAAPCFEFYPSGADPLPPKELFNRLTKELEAAKEAAEDTPTTEAIAKILFCTKSLNPS